MFNSLRKESPKEIIAINLAFLLCVYGKTRKEVCRDLSIPYTTFCDWIKGKTYPRVENLEVLGFYFRVETRDFFVRMEQNQGLVERLRFYAKEFGTRLDKDEEESGFSVEDYNETPEGYPLELIEGQFFVMESPNSRHQSIVMELSAEIRNYIRSRKGNCRVYPGPFDVELPSKKASVVVPDITVICDPQKINRKRCVGAPDWIVEILSETTAERDKVSKRFLYEKAGVREYWIVDQFHDSVSVYQQDQSDANCFLAEKIYSFQEQIPVGIYEDFCICFEDLDLDD